MVAKDLKGPGRWFLKARKFRFAPGITWSPSSDIGLRYVKVDHRFIDLEREIVGRNGGDPLGEKAVEEIKAKAKTSLQMGAVEDLEKTRGLPFRARKFCFEECQEILAWRIVEESRGEPEKILKSIREMEKAILWCREELKEAIDELLEVDSSLPHGPFRRVPRIHIAPGITWPGNTLVEGESRNENRSF